jgi:hypothetical protein
MKLITDSAGIAHLMAAAEERAAIHRTSAIYCGLQVIRERLFDESAMAWGPDMRFLFHSLSRDLAERAEACQVSSERKS